jgi:hypothetical protein
MITRILLQNLFCVGKLRYHFISCGFELCIFLDIVKVQIKTQAKLHRVIICLNPYLHRYTFIAWANSLDPDQPAHPCHLISFLIC